MVNWIPGPGLFVIQPVGPINEEENDKRLEEVKQKLEEAEKRFAMKLSSEFIK